LRILYISKTPNSGVPYRLSLLLGDGFSYSCLYDRPEIFPSGIEYGSEEFEEIHSGADFIILSCELDKKEARNKPYGRYYIDEPIYWAEEFPYRERSAVSAQYHWRYARDCEILPNPIPIDNKMFVPKPRPDGPIRIMYNPTNTVHESKVSSWNRKGYEATCTTLNRLKQGYGDQIDISVGNNIPHADIMKKRRISDIVIDECITGSYHGTSLESLSCGCAVLADIDGDTRSALGGLYADGSTEKTFPVIQTRWNRIGIVSEALIENPDYLGYAKEGSRTWMQTNYSESWQRKKWISWVRQTISRKI